MTIRVKAEGEWASRAGLIFDDRGNRMSPSYVVRRGSRHRYYVSSALLRGAKHDVGSRGRIGADEVERLVVGVLGQPDSLQELANRDRGDWSSEIRTLVRDNIENVIVQADALKIVRKADAAVGDDGAPIILSVPFPPPAPRARREILVPELNGKRPRRVSHALLLAIARARSWMDQLRSGRSGDVSEIATRYNMSEMHVRRLLRLNFLAPDILEAIVDGHQPPSLTVKRLLQGIPTAWEDQRSAFGFKP